MMLANVFVGLLFVRPTLATWPWDTTTTTSSEDVLYYGCNVEDYYADLLIPGTLTLREDVTREEVENLLEITHRNVLPYTNDDQDDVWKALMELDAGTEPDTVRLIYRQEEVPAMPHGTAETWNREHLWPKSRGVGDSGPDMTDVHHLRPADTTVNAARGNLFFGECATVERGDGCHTPAHEEAAPDTAADSSIFLPPPIVRGDIARAILYMDVRYSDHLTVTDCPTESDHEMAYKSALLQWHLQDPVTDAERRRNQRVCERWQGNRNPFVDFPDLAERVFGVPQTPLGEGLGYPCEIATKDVSSVPVHTRTLKMQFPCLNLTAGDVMFIAMNSDPDMVAMVALQDLEEGLTLSLTDNAFLGPEKMNMLSLTEGIITLQVPASGIQAGTVFGYSKETADLLYHDEWKRELGEFDLYPDGDTMLLFCKSETGGNNFLAGLDNTGNGWVPDTGTMEQLLAINGSFLPSQLAEGGAISFSKADNHWYTGAINGTVPQLKTWLVNLSMWKHNMGTSNAPPLPTMFTVVVEGESEASGETSTPSSGQRFSVFRSCWLFGALAVGLVMTSF